VTVAGKLEDGPQIRLVNGTPFSFVVDEAAGLRQQAGRAAAVGDTARAEKLRSLAEAKAAAPTMRPNPEVADLATVPKVILDWIEIEGPIVPEWPPRSHRELFFEGDGARKDLPYARRIFARLMARAFRRPVTNEDVAPAVRLVEGELAAGASFEQAVTVGLEYILCAPEFLFALLLLKLAQADAKFFGLNAKLGPVGWNFFGLFGCVVCHRNLTRLPG